MAIKTTKQSIAKKLGQAYGVAEELSVLSKYSLDERALSSHGFVEFVNRAYVSAAACEAEFSNIEAKMGSLVYDAKELANAQIVGAVQTGAISLARNGYSEFRTVFPDIEGILADVKRCGRYMFNCKIMTLAPIAGTKIGFERNGKLPTIESDMLGTKFLSFIHDGHMIGNVALSFSFPSEQSINTIAIETVFPVKNNVRRISFYRNGNKTAEVSNGVFKDGNYHYEKITSLPGIIYYSGDNVIADGVKIELDIGTFANNYHAANAGTIYSAMCGIDAGDMPCNSSMLLGDIMIGNAVKSSQASVKIYEDMTKKIAISSGRQFDAESDGLKFSLWPFNPATLKPEIVIGPFIIGKR